MRVNAPITQQEYLLDDGTTLMSTTDVKSHITYANSAFIRVSGFDEHELMGTPHNVVRHPDMPVEAFADMWYTLQQGDSWTGLVKNRRKNGDHYWVRANVTPVYHHNQLAGYISVRNTPKAEEIQAAEPLYEAVQSKQRAIFGFIKDWWFEPVCSRFCRCSSGYRCVHDYDWRSCLAVWCRWR